MSDDLEERRKLKAAETAIHEAASAGRIGYMCSKCRQSIEDPKQTCAAIIVTGWQRPEANQFEFQVFVHRSCIEDIIEYASVREHVDKADSDEGPANAS